MAMLSGLPRTVTSILNGRLVFRYRKSPGARNGRRASSGEPWSAYLIFRQRVLGSSLSALAIKFCRPRPRLIGTSRPILSLKEASLSLWGNAVGNTPRSLGLDDLSLHRCCGGKRRRVCTGLSMMERALSCSGSS